MGVLDRLDHALALKTLAGPGQPQSGRSSCAGTMYARLMPICVGVMCDSCERVYFLAHPDTLQRIQVTGQPDPLPPYELKCVCRAVRGFDRTKMLPYRVSDVIRSRGFAERDQYEAMPGHALK